MIRLSVIAALSVGAMVAGCQSESADKDDPARSKAAFTAMGKVLTHPRCVNCHPSADAPTHGDEMDPHVPPVVRGEAGLGAVGMRCNTCHGEENVRLTEGAGSLPGGHGWRLAPRSMAWQGKSLGDICKQLKDEARNGGKTLEEVHTHMAEDALVGWGWNPGVGRTPAPGTQQELAKHTREWIDTGAHCPEG